MIISGYHQRSIATQTGDFQYNLTTNFNTTTGRCVVSFSGTVGSLVSLTYVSGRVYDTNNRNIYGYTSGTDVTMQGYISSNNHNIYAEYIPIEFTGLRPTGYVDWLVVNPVGCSVDFDFSFSGQKPDFSIPYVNFANSGLTGTGYIVNNNNLRKFRLFTGNGITGNNYTITSFPTGNITGTGTFIVQRNLEQLSISQSTSNTGINSFWFETNFGYFESGVPISTSFPLIQSINYNVPLSFPASGETLEYFYWQNLIGAAFYTGALNNTITVSWYSGAEASSDFGADFTVQTGDLFGSGYTTLPYVSAITGYRSAAFPTYQSSGITVRMIQNSGFTGNTIVHLNYSGFNSGLDFYQTGFGQTVTQYLTASSSTGLNGNGATASGNFYWQNVYGGSSYSGALGAQVYVNWVQGLSSGDFNADFTVKTGNLDGTALTTLPYVSAITGYRSPVFSTYGQSGIYITVLQNSGLASTNVILLNYSGYNTGYNIYLTGYA